MIWIRAGSSGAAYEEGIVKFLGVSVFSSYLGSLVRGFRSLIRCF